MNFTLPMASSSEAVKPRQLLETSRVARGLTWVEGRLEGGESVILEHVQECLWGIQLACNVVFGNPTSSRSFRRYRDQGKGSSHSCARDLLWGGSVIGISSADRKKRLHTQLSKDIPEPVQDKHRGDEVVLGWTRRVSVLGWMSCPTVSRSRGGSGRCHVEPLPKSLAKIAKKILINSVGRV